MIQLEGRTERGDPRVVVLGTFDGVHRGHRELIRQGRLLADRMGLLLRVCSFDRHPLEVLFPDRAPLLLNTAEEKREGMTECGADELRIWHFDRGMAQLLPEEFLSLLGQECRLRAAVVGWNYTFGLNGSGGPELLRREGERQGWETVIVPPVKTAEGEIVSSSAIRRRLLAGEMESALNMLGWGYPITGIPEEEPSGEPPGGRSLRLRTAPRKLLPGPGLYTGELISGEALPVLLTSDGEQENGRIVLEVPAGAVTTGRPVRLRLYGAPAAEELPALRGALGEGGERARRVFEALGRLPRRGCRRDLE